jgi:hypothetical protein
MKASRKDSVSSGVIDEADVRHYRIGFDDYGTLDVSALAFR